MQTLGGRKLESSELACSWLSHRSILGLPKRLGRFYAHSAPFRARLHVLLPVSAAVATRKRSFEFTNRLPVIPAHVLLGDLDSKYSTAAIQRSMEGAAAEHSRAGKIAYNSHVEAKPSHLDQIFAACTPLLAAAVEYASDPASSAAEELRTTMRVQVESIHAIIADAPPPPATTHQRQLQLGRGRHMAAQQNSRPAHTMSKQPSSTSAATSKGSRPTGGANVGAAAPAPQEEGTSPKDTGHEKTPPRPKRKLSSGSSRHLQQDFEAAGDSAAQHH